MVTVDEKHTKVYAIKTPETVVRVNTLKELQELGVEVRMAEMQDGSRLRHFERTLNLYGPSAVSGFAENPKNKERLGYLGPKALLLDDAQLKDGGEIMDDAIVGGDVVVPKNARVRGNTVLMLRGGWRVREGAVIIGGLHLNASLEQVIDGKGEAYRTPADKKGRRVQPRKEKPVDRIVSVAELF